MFNNIYMINNTKGRQVLRRLILLWYIFIEQSDVPLCFRPPVFLGVGIDNRGQNPWLKNNSRLQDQKLISLPFRK